MGRKPIELALKILATVLVPGSIAFVVPMFFLQYNDQGVGSLLVVSIDESQPKEYVGELEGHRVYVEGLDPDECYFVSVAAKNIPLDQALEDELVSMDDWRDKAWDTVQDGDAEILRYENYEIAIAYDDCVIRPLSE